MSHSKKLWVYGNWKMNHTVLSAIDFIQEFKAALPQSGAPRVQSVLFMPALFLGNEGIQKSGVPLGAQNAHWDKSGAMTGETSAPMLLEAGVSRVLVGHSERRQYFGETDLSCAKRLQGLWSQGLEVTACIGETRSEREDGKTFEVLARQLDALFLNSGLGVSAGFQGRLLIAYEPVWAIGTGLTATPEQAQEVHAWIRCRLSSYGVKEHIPLLYGGSVNLGNVATLVSQSDIDGALVGGASLKARDWAALLSACQ